MGIGLSHRISFSSPIFAQRRPGVPGRHRFVPELTIMNIYTPVERRDSDVTCPKCGGETIKDDYPLRPMPDVPGSTNGALGRVFCERCNDTYPWSYRSASTT